MLHLSTVHPHTLELLRRLQQLPALSRTRLVGGTALALQYGHRQSIDLVFFGQVNAEREELITQLKSVGTLTILKDSANIHIYLLDGVKIDIVNYTYSWIDSSVCKGHILMASTRDIAAMKLSAIVGRGTKKDFIDLYYLSQYYTLLEMLDFYTQKYPDGSSFMVLKSLAYFDDADQEMTPHMMKPISWVDVKQAIIMLLG